MEQTTALQSNGTQAPRTQLVPPVDIYENEEGYLILVDVPGAQRDSLEVRAEHQRLELRARQAPPDRLLDAKVGDFYRSIALPDGVDLEKITAQLHGGVLSVELKKSEAVKPRRIAVTCS